jgi:hypothetical protein
MTPNAAPARPNFLQQLIERSLDAQGAIEPRVPSMFESAGAASVLPPNVEEDVTPQAPLARTAAAHETNGPQRDLKANTEIRDRDSASSSHQSRTAQIPAAAPANKSSTLAPSTIAAESIRRIVEERITHESPAPPPQRIDMDVPPPSRARAAGDSPPYDALAEPNRPPVSAAKALEPPPLLRSAIRERVTAEPPAAMAAIAAMRNSAAAEPPRAAPDVHVTIGRLEIRATQSAKPPQAGSRTSAAQPMSLEEYLKQRGGRQ